MITPERIAEFRKIAEKPLNIDDLDNWINFDDTFRPNLVIELLDEISRLREALARCEEIAKEGE